MISSDSDGVLIGHPIPSQIIPDRREGSRAESSPIPLFLRDVGQYYWDKRTVLAEYPNPDFPGWKAKRKYFSSFEAYNRALVEYSVKNKINIVKYLRENLIEPERDLTLFEYACENCDLEMVRYMHRMIDDDGDVLDILDRVPEMPVENMRFLGQSLSDTTIPCFLAHNRDIELMKRFLVKKIVSIEELKEAIFDNRDYRLEEIENFYEQLDNFFI
jgi:hypothetical protein